MAAVTVSRHPRDRRTVTVDDAVLSGWHVTRRTGGLHLGTGGPKLAAYMSCAEIPAGVPFGHSCRHGRPPHRIKVIVRGCGAINDHEGGPTWLI